MPYLSEALASLEAQTFRDFEVCLWDNGSTDGSVEEAMRWIPDRLPGRVVTGHPLPLHECLARMVEEAQTELVARMDGDDVCFPQRLELELDAIQRDPSLGLIGGQCIYIGPNGKEISAREVLPSSHQEIMMQILFRSALTHPAVMFRRRAVLNSGNYSVPKPIEDVDLYMKMARQWRFRNLGEKVLKYRIHPQSVSRRENKLQAAKMIEVVASHAQENYGIGGDAYLKLRSKKSLCAIKELLRIAKYLSRKHKSKMGEIVFNPFFVSNGRCLTGQHDILSKIGFRIIEACSRFTHG
jgi:glycosyltransferase involved in cell wall biosynthesis